jgi:hypothetical protein
MSTAERWYRIETGAEEVRIEFHPSGHRYWPPEVLRWQPLPAQECRGRRVVVTGNGAVWMYAHAAALLRAAGAAEVVICSGAAPGTSPNLEGSVCALRRSDSSGGQALLSVELRKDPPLADAAIEQLLRQPLDELETLRLHELCITGRAGVRVYAQAAGRAVAAGIDRITCWTPVDGLVLVFDRVGGHTGERLTPPGWLEALLPAPEESVIIGVTGDPNVGKSVFSSALDHYRWQVRCAGWRFDCDGQSPTPPWYLSRLREQPEAALLAREASKRPWTPEMEAEIAGRLGRLRRCFPVVIADLPGGHHKITSPMRIPPGRERVFRPVDALILLDKLDKDGSTEAAWRDALRSHGLECRLVAVLRSRNPEGAPRLELDSQGDLWRGAVQGLKRGSSPEDLATAFGGALGQLWPALLARGGKNRTNA